MIGCTEPPEIKEETKRHQSKPGSSTNRFVFNSGLQLGKIRWSLDRPLRKFEKTQGVKDVQKLRN